jgi:hypothetical protein
MAARSTTCRRGALERVAIVRRYAHMASARGGTKWAYARRKYGTLGRRADCLRYKKGVTITRNALI